MAKETPIRTKRSDAKRAADLPAKSPAQAAKPVNAVTVMGGPELIVTKATDKGVSCVVRNARLTWVFVKDFREDKQDWRKGVKSVTLLIPKKGARSFQEQLAAAVKQTLQLNKKIVTLEGKKEAMLTALAVNAEGSLLKDGDEAKDAGGNPRAELAGYLTWQVKKTGFRDAKTDAFGEPYPLTFHDATGRPVQPEFIDREFYSGVYADVAFTLATYSTNGNEGVTAYLNGLRKNRDGERIGGFDPFAGVAPAGAGVMDSDAADVDFL